jgi:FAD-linked sulfhydryl oxidase
VSTNASWQQPAIRAMDKASAPLGVLWPALMGALVGGGAVAFFGRAELDGARLLERGWRPPGLNTSELMSLVEAKQAGGLSDDDFALRKAAILGCASKGCSNESSPPTPTQQDGGSASAFTWEELAKHNTKDNCWVAVHGEVYNFSCFLDERNSCYTHPGNDVLAKQCGADGTEAFDAAGHRAGIAQRKGVGHIVLGKLPPPPPAVAGAAGGGGSGGWRCENEDCKWVGFHKDPRSWQKVIGTHAWFFIHSVAAKYPEHPSEADQRAMMDFVAFLGQLYPCKVCRLNLQQELRYEQVSDPASLGKTSSAGNYTAARAGGAQYYGLREAVRTRNGLAVWLCRLHNIVNRDVGNPEFNCEPITLDMLYLKNCGDCQVKKPKEGDNPLKAEKEALVWDHGIFRAGGLTSKVRGATDQFMASELEELLQVRD